MRDTMANLDRQPSPTASGPSRRGLLAVALIISLILSIAVFVVSRDTDSATTAPSNTSPTTSAPVVTRVPDSRGTVVARLREILEVREQAFRERDASLFDEVYTSNCPCLRAGRDAIAALKKENILWQGRSISIEVQSAMSVSPMLWEVVAIFVSDSFRIETEEGRLIRRAPAERIRYRFLLVRTSDTDSLRLGSASPVES
jgi:hypothetical protein